ncbi:MAG: MBL fold metallo-hydrolase [Pseudomonadota bacterium]
MSRLRFTVLGCGASGGVPRLGGPDETGQWGACDPLEPKNRRRRCALLVERFGPGGVTRVLVDAGPDIRQQLLDARVGWLDATLFTHDHADHIHGIDDLRLTVFVRRKLLDVWADEATMDTLRRRFGYVFETPEGSAYPPILTAHKITRDQIEGRAPLVIEGAGGPIAARPFEVRHGRISSLGFRFGDVAYLPDVSGVPETTWPALQGLDLWIVDALRLDPHPSHAHLALTLEWIARAAPRRAVLTNMNIELDYAATNAATPEHVTPAHDGMMLYGRAEPALSAEAPATREVAPSG